MVDVYLRDRAHIEIKPRTSNFKPPRRHRERKTRSHPFSISQGRAISGKGVAAFARCFPDRQEISGRTRTARASAASFSTRLQSALSTERQRQATIVGRALFGSRQTGGAD